MQNVLLVDELEITRLTKQFCAVLDFYFFGSYRPLAGPKGFS